MCQCAETFYRKRDKRGKITNEVVHVDPPPKFHDCSYVIRRNELIDEAEKRAAAMVPVSGGSPSWRNHFAKAFTVEMDKAVAKARLLA